MTESLKGARTLVTGGAGMIGSHLCDRLVDAGCDVVIYDDFSRGRIMYLGFSLPRWKAV
jgi:UDP-glucose 4-epimerase